MIRKLKIILFILPIAIAFSIVPFKVDAQPATRTVSISTNKAYAFRMGDTTIVTKTLAGKDASSSPWVKSLYNTCRMFLNIAAFLLLIFIAFMNILQKDIETYGIKKMLPLAIYALILGNLGLPIFALASRMVDALMGIKMFSPINLTQIYQTIIGGQMGSGSVVFMVIAVVAALSFWNCFGFCFFFLIMGVPLLGVIILNLLLSIRPIIIYLAAAVSPIAFAANILPGTQQYFKRWLGIIFPWLIFPPLVAFFFYIARLIPGNTAVNTPAGWGFVPVILSIALPILAKAGLLYFAIRLPFTLEKDIAGLAATAGKAAANWGWNKGRDLGGRFYNKIDDHEKEYMNKNFTQEEHQKHARDKAEKLVNEDDFKDAAGVTDTVAYEQAKKDFVKANPKIVRSLAKASAKDKFKSQHALAYGALKYNPFGVMDAYKERKELATNKGITAAKKFSDVNAKVGGKNYEGKYKYDSTSSDLKEVFTPGEVYSYAPKAFTQIQSQVKKELDAEVKSKNFNDLSEYHQKYAILATEEEKRKFARHQMLEELRDMSTNDAGDSSYTARWKCLDAKGGGEFHAINRRLWAVAGRTTSRDENIALDKVEAALEGGPSVVPTPHVANPVDDIGEIQDNALANDKGEGDNSLANIIAGAVDSAGSNIAGQLPTAIAAGLSGAKIKAEMPEIRATVDGFAGEALSLINESGLDPKAAQSLIAGASLGNVGMVESSIQAHGGDASTNPFFLAIRRAAGAGYLQQSTENSIVQEIAKSDDANTTLMMAQKLAPAISAQGGEGMVSQHLKTLMDVTAGVQIQPQAKADMERYFANLNLGVKVGGELDLDPMKIQSALTALKSPEFSIDPKLTIGKATLSNGYADNVKDAIQAAMANKIPDDAIAYDQTVDLRLNETIRAEANVRGVDLSKASMEAIERAKQQIKSQIVSGGNAQMAVAQTFDTLVQDQPQVVRQNAPRAQAPAQQSASAESPAAAPPPPAPPISPSAPPTQ